MAASISKKYRSKQSAKKTIKKIVVSDIESTDWINFLCIGYYDGKTYEWFDSLDNYFEYIFKTKTKEIYFHYGGGFDFLFLLKYCFENWESYRVTSMIPRGSKFLTVTIQDDETKRKIKFLDSTAILPFSLRTLAENFGVETKKGTIDYEKIKKITPELLEYMRDDHLALYQVLTKFQANQLISKVGLKMTIASQAYNIFTKLYLDKEIKPLHKEVIDFSRKAYQGGRTEIFKPVFLGDNLNTLKCYDVNSLYPFVMSKHDYPISFSHFSHVLELHVMSICHVRVYVPRNMYIPPLGVISENGKYIFPVGEFDGTWTNVELAMAIKYGCKILKVYQIAVFNNGGKIFSNFVNNLYSLRKTSLKNSADNIIYKLLMNSLYGRFALDTDREKIVIDDGSLGIKPYLDIPLDNGLVVSLGLQEVEIKTPTFVPIAVFVTSYARVHCYEKYIHPYQNELFYTDTDSFYLLRDLPSSGELGELKLEKTDSSACFILPKSYIAGDMIKLKGFDAKKTGNFTIDDFLAQLDGEIRIKQELPKRMAKFRESLRRNKKILSMLPKSEKIIRSQYDKRELIKLEDDLYDTFPIIISD